MVAPQYVLLVSVELLMNDSFAKWQPENALLPMLVTELGIVTEVRPEQL